jgi:membrane-bound serine protease (ClpP class)
VTQIILYFSGGLLLVLVEVFVPSGGVLGLVAALSIVWALVLAFMQSFTAGFALLTATAILVPLLVTYGMRVFPKTPMGRKLTARGFSFEDGRAVDRRDADLGDRTGVVESDLRPAGIARIDGRRVDVVSRGEPIEAGARIVVVEVSGNRVIVARDDSEPPS